MSKLAAKRKGDYSTRPSKTKIDELFKVLGTVVFLQKNH